MITSPSTPLSTTKLKTPSDDIVSPIEQHVVGKHQQQQPAGGKLLATRSDAAKVQSPADGTLSKSKQQPLTVKTSPVTTPQAQKSGNISATKQNVASVAVPSPNPVSKLQPSTSATMPKTSHQVSEFFSVA